MRQTEKVRQAPKTPNPKARKVPKTMQAPASAPAQSWAESAKQVLKSGRASGAGGRTSRHGDIVTLKVKRGDENLVFKVTLGQADDIFFQFAPTQFNGPLSSRRDDFFRAIQHDTVIQPNLCGGPVLDSRGRMVGLNVARADRIATYMVPSTILKSLVVQWTSTEQPPEPQ